MSFRGSTTIVASPRPRVGKTLLARLLTDFHLHEGRSVAAYDLNAGERTLAQFLPEKTTIATIRDINGQMALFDRLVADEDTTKVMRRNSTGAFSVDRRGHASGGAGNMENDAESRVNLFSHFQDAINHLAGSTKIIRRIH
jgi:hypothetical protein